MAKWLVLGVALIIGVIGGILFAIDIVRWVVYLVAKRKKKSKSERVKGMKEEMLVKCADELIDDKGATSTVFERYLYDRNREI